MGLDQHTHRFNSRKAQLSNTLRTSSRREMRQCTNTLNRHTSRYDTGQAEWEAIENPSKLHHKLLNPHTISTPLTAAPCGHRGGYNRPKLEDATHRAASGAPSAHAGGMGLELSTSRDPRSFVLYGLVSFRICSLCLWIAGPRAGGMG